MMRAAPPQAPTLLVKGYLARLDVIADGIEEVHRAAADEPFPNQPTSEVRRHDNELRLD